MRPTLLPVVALTLLVSACARPPAPAGSSARTGMSETFHSRRLAVFELRPPLVARPGQNLEAVRRRLAHTRPEELAHRRLARPVRVDALPFLTETAEGRAYLAAPSPKALARGAPAASCPAVAAAAVPPAAGDEGAAVTALRTCLARLGPHAEGCGCRLIAIDDVVLVPQQALAYATGVAARLYAPELGLDALLVAEATPDGGVLLRDLRGPVARLERGPDSAVTLVLLDGGRRFEGRSIPVGFHRGRIAERIYATDTAGRRLRLLIGFDPRELATYAGAWLAWPKSG